MEPINTYGEHLSTAQKRASRKVIFQFLDLWLAGNGFLIYLHGAQIFAQTQLILADTLDERFCLQETQPDYPVLKYPLSRLLASRIRYLQQDFEFF